MKKRVRSSGGSTGGHGENERTESSNCKANAKEKAALSSHASVHCPEVNGDSDDDCSLAKKARMLPVQNAANMPCSGSPNDGVVDAEAVGRFAPDTDVPSCNDSVSAHDPYRPCPIILSMKLLNFMCHENLALDFGPHINFIVGQNGSGKSAVLTALMVCLGASASKTQRGHRLSSLIKQNASASISLFNGGRERYRFDVYGSRITVERRITQDGASSYKIKSSSDAIISTKREEVSDICSFFKLQVENPMAILTQDVAKRYLASSSPSDKYRFVMQGSHLEQLAQDYQYTKNQISQMSSMISSAQHRLLALLKEKERLQGLVDSFKAYRDLLSEQTKLKQRLAWAQVYEHQDSLEKAKCSLHTLLLDIKRGEDEVLVMKEKMAALVSGKAAIESSIGTIRTSQLSSLKTKDNQMASQISIIDSHISNIDGDERILTETARQLSVSLSSLTTAIATQNSVPTTANNATVTSHEGLLPSLPSKYSVESSIAKEEQRLESLSCEISRHEGTMASMDSETHGARLSESQLAQQLATVRGQVAALQARLDNLNISKASTAVYGERIPDLLAFIKEHSSLFVPPSYSAPGCSSEQSSSSSKCSLSSCMPVGPIGMHVHLKRAGWSQAMEALIGRHMSSFVVKTYRDRDVLLGLFRRFKCENQIVVWKGEGKEDDQMTDGYERGTGQGILASSEPPLQYLTAYRALTIDSKIVSRVILSLSSIHRVLLCESREEAMAILHQKIPSIDYAFLPDGAKVSLNTRSTTFFSFGTGRPSKYFDNREVISSSLLQDIQRKTQYLSQLEAQLSEARKHLSILMDGVSEAEKKHGLFLSEKQSIMGDIRQLKRRLSQMEQMSLEPSSSLLLERDSYMKRVEILKTQLADLGEKRHSLKEKKSALAGQALLVQEEISSVEKHLSSLNSKFRSCSSEHQSLLLALNQLASRLALMSQSQGEVQSEIDSLEKELQQVAIQAAQYTNGETISREDIRTYGDKLDSDDRERDGGREHGAQPLPSSFCLAELIRKIRVLERRLQKEPPSPSEIDSTMEKMEKTCTELVQTQKNISFFERLVLKLESSTHLRMERWREYRKIISLRSDVHFKWFVSQRDFYGRLVFDHERETLHIIVNRNGDLSEGPDGDCSSSRGAAGSTRKRDLRGLSGGEKSLVTSCLLLALWECVESPIRCLDEFDVFMDGVNRQTIMAMLIEYACKASSFSNQYIFITPQALFLPENLSPNIKIIRLRDPERQKDSV